MTVVFVAKHETPLPVWQKAFPRLRYLQQYATTNVFLNEDVIFVDLTQLSVEEGDRLIKAGLAQSKPVIGLSAQPSMKEAVRIMKLGASGYGHSYSSETRLKEMASAVVHGGIWVGQEMMKQVLAALSFVSQPQKSEDSESKRPTALSNLTEREFSVAKQVALGATNAEIAADLGITERTVKAHIATLFKKLTVRNRVELALLINKGYKKSDLIGNRNNNPVL